MIVIDASAAVDFVLQTPLGQKITKRIPWTSETLHAPHLIDVEVAHVLRRYSVLNALEPERLIQGLSDFLEINIQRYAHDILLEEVWRLRHNLTAFDAMYVALAGLLEAPLITTDAKLASSKGHRSRIELIE